MRADALIILALIFMSGLALVALLLNVVWSREQVKKDLRRRICAPIHVRWYPYPFGNWRAFRWSGFAFQVTFVDATGCVQEARCVVDSRFHTVTWIGNEVPYLDPNAPVFWRWFCLVAALVFLWFGVAHLITLNLTLPRTRPQIYSHQPPPQWHGWPVALLSLASLCCAAHLLTAAFFHRMTEAREKRWTIFARVIAVIGWLLFFASFAGAFYEEITR